MWDGPSGHLISTSTFHNPDQKTKPTKHKKSRSCQRSHYLPSLISSENPKLEKTLQEEALQQTFNSQQLGEEDHGHIWGKILVLCCSNSSFQIVAVCGEGGILRLDGHRTPQYLLKPPFDSKHFRSAPLVQTLQLDRWKQSDGSKTWGKVIEHPVYLQQGNNALEEVQALESLEDICRFLKRQLKASEASKNVCRKTPITAAPLLFTEFSTERASCSVSSRGGRNKGGRKQMRANANKRRQTRTNASKRRGENASKRGQTQTNAYTPPLYCGFLHPPLQSPKLHLCCRMLLQYGVSILGRRCQLQQHAHARRRCSFGWFAAPADMQLELEFRPLHTSNLPWGSPFSIWHWVLSLALTYKNSKEKAQHQGRSQNFGQEVSGWKNPAKIPAT